MIIIPEEKKIDFLEASCDLTDDQKELIRHAITPGGNFLWLFREATIKFNYFAHILMDRSENPLVNGQISSPFFEPFNQIFQNFCKKHNIPVKTILRSSINNNYYYPDKFGDIHVDHNFPHYNFLLYMNDFTDGPTFLFNEDGTNMIREIKAEKYKAVIFPGVPHAAGFCAPGENRIVMITTFTTHSMY
jgi:hypothetical protein